MMPVIPWTGWLALAVFANLARVGVAGETSVPIMFSGGHETDPRDGGRPVILVAAGLGVPSDVFRKAFRGVTPARGGPPSREQAQRNKRALLKVLGPLGVTNDRLDEVSDYYRYRPQRGELWRTKPARAHAVVTDGRVTQIVVTDPGSGYSSPPVATIQGHDETQLDVKLLFDKDLKKNGGIKSIEVSSPNRAAKPGPKP
jgi:hypothetical protein